MGRRLFLGVVFSLSVSWLGTQAVGQPNSDSQDSVPTPNWTIGTGGKGSWLYSQYCQLGPNGFLGPYDIDQSVTQARPGQPDIKPGDFASLNGWMGVQNYFNPNNGNYLTSGANSGDSCLALELNPSTTFGWASLMGRYKITPYDTGTQPGVEQPVSPGQWTMWNVDVTMPIGGSLGVGKNFLMRGCGLQFSSNRTQEQILYNSYPISMPDFIGNWLPWLVRHPETGPVRATCVKICRKPVYCPPVVTDGTDCDGERYFSYDPRAEEEINECIDSGNCQETALCDDCPSGTFPIKIVLDETAKADFHKTKLYTRPIGLPVYQESYENLSYLTLGLGFSPWQQETLISNQNPDSSAAYPFPWNKYDVNIAQRLNLLAYLAWHNDVLEFQVGTLCTASHAGPELAQSTALRNAFPTTDRYTREGWLYLKYWNNRILFRTELDWFTRETRFQRSMDGTFFGNPEVATPGSGSAFAPQFIDSWRFMADATVYFGPMAFKLFYSHMPGPDRRHGIIIKQQPTIEFYKKDFLEQAGLDPFYGVASLLAYRFGGGVNSPGDLSDASVIAGRIDYLVAANLNINASFLYATRVSHGYGSGWIRPALNQSLFGQVQYDPELRTYLVNPVTGLPRGHPFTENVPAIPHRNLGWEVNVEILWQLLDQFKVNFILSYWRPGKWFNYACVDKSVAGWNVPTAANNWGVNPDRSIDPVLGVELGLLTSF